MGIRIEVEETSFVACMQGKATAAEAEKITTGDGKV